MKENRNADDEIPTIIPNKMSPREFLTTLGSFNPEFLYSSFAPLIYSEALISEELIRIEGVNRDGYIIFFQVI